MILPLLLRIHNANLEIPNQRCGDLAEFKMRHVATRAGIVSQAILYAENQHSMIWVYLRRAGHVEFSRLLPGSRISPSALPSLGRRASARGCILLHHRRSTLGYGG